MSAIPEGLELVDVSGSILKLEPGDILVLSCDHVISDVTAARLRDQIKRDYGVKCMVLGDGLKLHVLRPVPAMNEVPH